jgi:hypothetical protein
MMEFRGTFATDSMLANRCEDSNGRFRGPSRNRNAIVHGGRLGANVHLLGKPYTQQDLDRKIRELLDSKP